MEEKTRSARRESQLLKIINQQTPKKYKIELDESIKYVPKEKRGEELIWNEYIPAYKGIIYLSCASPLELAFFTESIGKINTIEKEVKENIKIVRMDGEGIIYFPFSLIKKMLRLAKAKTQRKITEEHKQILNESLKNRRKAK